jgi:hypothetical protein
MAQNIPTNVNTQVNPGGNNDNLEELTEENKDEEEPQFNNADLEFRAFNNIDTNPRVDLDRNGTS